jgi:hypothetical protein
MYYPQSQIITNLYTNGNELVYVSSQAQYIGYYYKTSNGKYFTGKTPQDGPNVELTTISINTDLNNLPILYSVQVNTFDNTIEDYNNIKNNSQVILKVPSYYQPQPTQQDYQIGEFRRYFTKKTNELLYTEVSKDTYDNILNKNSQWLWQDYLAFNIPWSISGDKLTVAKTNKNIVDLTIKNLILPKFNDYLRNDYLKFYK